MLTEPTCGAPVQHLECSLKHKKWLMYAQSMTPAEAVLSNFARIQIRLNSGVRTVGVPSVSLLQESQQRTRGVREEKNHWQKCLDH